MLPPKKFGLETHDTETIRAELLAVHGIGPETADDILLYALDRPVFVIDAYSRRLFARLGSIDGHEDYEALRARIERFLGPDVPVYQEYHALIVHRGSAALGPIASVAASEGTALGPPPIDTGWSRVERRGEMLNYELQDVKEL